MNWLYPRYENAQDARAADAEPRNGGGPVQLDPYRDVPLGVECAWPAAAKDGTNSTPS